jgi:hypothetical protein
LKNVFKVIAALAVYQQAIDHEPTFEINNAMVHLQLNDGSVLSVYMMLTEMMIVNSICLLLQKWKPFISA